MGEADRQQQAAEPGDVDNRSAAALLRARLMGKAGPASSTSAALSSRPKSRAKQASSAFHFALHPLPQWFSLLPSTVVAIFHFWPCAGLLSRCLVVHAYALAFDPACCSVSWLWEGMSHTRVKVNHPHLQVQILPSVDAEGRAMPGAFGREAAGEGQIDGGRCCSSPQALKRPQSATPFCMHGIRMPSYAVKS